MEGLWEDIRYGLRMLVKNPRVTVVAIFALALSIGANTAVFSVIKAVLLDPLPYEDAARLVAVYSQSRDLRTGSISYLNFLDWERDNRTFSSMAAFREANFILTGMGEAQRVEGEMVSAGFFPLLGVKPVIGRGFTAQEDREGGTPVALISEGLWKREFASSPRVVGKTLTLNGTVYTIVGVIPGDFHYESGNFQRSDIYVPIGQWGNPTFRNRGAAMGTDAVGRLRPGVSLAQAREDMTLVASHLALEYPDTDKDIGAALIPLKQDIVGKVRPLLLVVFAVVVFFLMIACSNVATLQLARADARSHEFAIRAALGATSGRVIRQLLTESLLLGFSGGALGLVLAVLGTGPALRLLPETLPQSSAAHLDGGVLVFTLAISLFAGILFGMVPALKSSRPDVHEELKEGLRGGSSKRHSVQKLLVAVELALAVALLIGAGLMIRSLRMLWKVNPGFDPHHVLIFSLSSSRPLGAAPGEVQAAMDQIRQQLEVVPGVRAASLTLGSVPMVGDLDMPFWIAGQPKSLPGSQMNMALLYAVQPGYLKVMKIPIVHGRFFTSEDNAYSVPVVVIDTRFARLYFGNHNPVGQRVKLGIGTSAEVIGIVGHVRQWGLNAGGLSRIQGQIYLPVSQIPDRFMSLMARRLTVALRSSLLSSGQVSAIRQTIQRFGTGLIMYRVETMDGIISNSLAAQRFLRILLSVFAGFAVLLSCVGIYSVVSYLTRQRMHEMGIRIALGAQRGDILRLVLGQGIRLTLVGVATGIAVGLGLTRFLGSQLFGVTATDPLTFAGVAILLTLVALAACYIPARRAMRVDPVTALKYE